MTLQQKLDDLKSKFESSGPPYNAPKAVIEIFHRATDELRQSGLAERALKTGDRAHGAGGSTDSFTRDTGARKLAW